MYQWNKYAKMTEKEEEPFWKKTPLSWALFKHQARSHGRHVQEYLQEYYNVLEQTGVPNRIMGIDRARREGSEIDEAIDTMSYAQIRALQDQAETIRRHAPVLIDVRPTQIWIDDFEANIDMRDVTARLLAEEENILGEHPIQIPRP